LNETKNARADDSLAAVSIRQSGRSLRTVPRRCELGNGEGDERPRGRENRQRSKAISHKSEQAMADDAAGLEFRGGRARLIAAMRSRAVHNSGMRLLRRNVRLQSLRNRRSVAGEAEQENSGHE
jgi:hypothetical protein